MKDKMLQRSNRVCFILNDNGADLFHNSKFILNKLIEVFSPTFCAVIKHDKDIDDEINQLKTIHYHVVMCCYSNMILQSYLFMICKTFHCNENQITIEKCGDIVMSTQYLIHQNDLDKYQYYPFDIESNDTKVLHAYLSKIVKINTTEEAVALYDRFDGNIRSLMKNLSKKVYKDWRIFFQDLERFDNKRRW